MINSPSIIRMRILPFLAIILLVPTSGFAKRGAPPVVPPVSRDQVVYTVTPEPEKMGWVEAWSVKSGRRLWKKTVYRIGIWPLLERDTQWVFITSLTLEGNRLIISNERDEWFSLDLKSRSVKRIAPPSSLQSHQPVH